MSASGLIDVVVKYCGSCGYRNHFLHLQEALQRHAGERLGKVTGEMFVPSTAASTGSLLLQCVFYIGIFLITLGQYFFTSVVPSAQALRAVRVMKANQITVMLALFSVYLLSTKITNTGAYEVFYNDVLVHSKLASGIAPDIGTLLKQFKEFAGATGK